jgi:hypothetical protein
MMRCFWPYGPNPKAGTVEQKVTTDGMLNALAKWRGAESFTTISDALRIIPATSINVSLPIKLITLAF